jgi:hypothetical protein
MDDSIKPPLRKETAPFRKIACDGELLGYEQIFNRYVELGQDDKFEERDREFKNRESAAAIFGKSPKGLDHMIEDASVASIRVHGTVWVHIPTSSALLLQRKRWDPGPGFPEDPKHPKSKRIP